MHSLAAVAKSYFSGENQALEKTITYQLIKKTASYMFLLFAV